MNDQRLRRRGDSRARSEFAARYLPLARSLALRYVRSLAIVWKKRIQPKERT